MSNKQDHFDQYSQMAELTEEQRKAQHEANHAGDSHMRPGGLFDPAGGRDPKALVLAEDEDRVARHKIKRQIKISEAVGQALNNRTLAPVGVNLMAVSWDEFLKIRKDPDFEPFSKYSFAILNYVGGAKHGQPRPQPVRPFVQNEIGMYKGRIVTCKSMPDQGRGDIPYVQVTAQLEAEPDPFPAKPAFTLTVGDKK